MVIDQRPFTHIASTTAAELSDRIYLTSSGNVAIEGVIDGETHLVLLPREVVAAAQALLSPATEPKQ